MSIKPASQNKEAPIVIDLEDIGTKYITLESGSYLIDGKLKVINNGYSSKKKISVKNIDDIRIVKNTELKSHYENGNGDKLSIQDFIDKKSNLLENSIDGEDGYYFSAEFLDDEYKYKKFVRDWNLIKRPVQQISDPIYVEIVKTKYDTGNPHIRNLLECDVDNISMLCIYDRPEAIFSIVKDYMTSIGVSFVGDKNHYNLRSEWSNSKHSGIRYAKAFGSYLFGNEWEIRANKKGTLEDCLKWYNEDKEKLENIIHRQFMNAFGKINENNFDFGELLKKLKYAKSSLSKVDPKIKTMQDYNSSVKKIRECIEAVESKMEVE